MVVLPLNECNDFLPTYNNAQRKPQTTQKKASANVWELCSAAGQSWPEQGMRETTQPAATPTRSVSIKWVTKHKNPGAIAGATFIRFPTIPSTSP